MRQKSDIEVNMIWKEVYIKMKEKYPKEFAEFIEMLDEYYKDVPELRRNG